MDQSVDVAEGRALPDPPKNDRELAHYQAHIGKLMRRRDALITSGGDKIAKIAKQRDDRIAKLETQMKELANAVYSYAQTHEERFTMGGLRKTVATPGGSFRWAESRWSVAITDVVEKVVARLERRHKDLVRVKKEPDKELILKQRELFEVRPVKGVSFVKKALFYINPLQTESALVRDIKEGTWELSTPAKKKS